MTTVERAAEVLDGHRYDSLYDICGCGSWSGGYTEDEPPVTHAEHVAQALAEAGVLAP